MATAEDGTTSDRPAPANRESGESGATAGVRADARLGQVAEPPARTGGRDWDVLWERYGITALLLVSWGVAALFVPHFANIDNFTNVLRQSAFVGISAVGMTMAIIAGTFDLSVGSTLGLCAWIAVAVAGHQGVLPAILAAVVAGALVGAVNGILVAVIRIPAFVATLGMLFVVSGFTYIVTSGEAARYSGAEFINLGNGDLVGVPVPFLIFAACALIGAAVLHQTAFGRYLYALGSSSRAALVAGVPVRHTVFAIFVVVGVFTAIAAVLEGARLYSAGPGLEPGFELNVIAAVVLGGTRLAGGRGSMLGTFAAAILFVTLGNLLNLLQVDAFVQRVAVGVVLLLALSIAGIRQRLAERASRG